MADFWEALCLSLGFFVLGQRVHSCERISRWGDLLALFCAAFVFSFFLLLFQRPWVAFLLSSALMLLLFVVNEAKKRALRGEPLLFSDVSLLRQVILYPHLYLPFLPTKAILLGAALFVPLFFLVFFKSALFFSLPSLLLMLPLLCLAGMSLFPTGASFAYAFFQKQGLHLDIGDSARFGPLGAALLHSLAHFFWRKCTKKGIPKEMPSFVPYPYIGNTAHLPNLIVIQEESFCDPRLFSPLIPRDILINFDHMAHTGARSELLVNAYGAYTMRTEYEILSGISQEHLGIDAFHPYFRASCVPSWSYAAFLREKGYRTVCLHPYAKSFFYRDLALPNMGFSSFLALEDLRHLSCFGPYVSDPALAEEALRFMEKAEQPVFAFLITMENHGPWGEGRLEDESLLYTEELSNKRLCRYLTHLKNADAMLGFLSRSLTACERPSLLVVYGDHLPNLPHVLIPDSAYATPCLWWKSRGKLRHMPKARMRPCEVLPFLLGEID